VAKSSKSAAHSLDPLRTAAAIVQRRPYKPVVSTAVLEDSHVLMVREARGLDRKKWNLPGGKTDASESLLEAAAREAQEETGHAVRIDALRGLYTYVNRSGIHRLRVMFLGRIVGGEPEPADGKEIMDVRWFTLRQLDAMSDAELSKPHVLRRMLADLHNPVRYPLNLLHEFDPALSVF
jgi:ADP-ribose pyrophosphatase YjhB (NUDIX family)